PGSVELGRLVGEGRPRGPGEGSVARPHAVAAPRHARVGGDVRIVAGGTGERSTEEPLGARALLQVSAVSAVPDDARRPEVSTEVKDRSIVLKAADRAVGRVRVRDDVGELRDREVPVAV